MSARGSRPQVNADGGYRQAEQKQKFLTSALDSHGFSPDFTRKQAKTPRGGEIRAPTVYETSSTAGRLPMTARHVNQSREVKQQSLSSAMGGGESSLHHHVGRSPVREESQTIDLHLKQIPENTDDVGFRKMAGARHIVDSRLQHDNLTGALTGEGRLRIRLA